MPWMRGTMDMSSAGMMYAAVEIMKRSADVCHHTVGEAMHLMVHQSIHSMLSALLSVYAVRVEWTVCVCVRYFAQSLSFSLLPASTATGLGQQNERIVADIQKRDTVRVRGVCE